MTEGTNDARLDRQEQIWAGLYGAPRARTLVENAREALGADPDADIERILAELEPVDGFDTDEAGTMRPI